MKKNASLIFTIIFFTFTVYSCNDSEVEKLNNEIKVLKQKNILTKEDSISIFRDLYENTRIKEVNKYLDSLKRVDEKYYDILIDEASNRDIKGITDIY